MQYCIKWFAFFILFLILTKYSAAQDIALHINNTFFKGQNILSVKRDFKDPYLWVLAENNKIYRVNSNTQTIDDYTAIFSGFNNFQFIDIAGQSQDTVFVATNSSTLIEYKKGTIKTLGGADGIPGNINSIGIDYTAKYLVYNTNVPFPRIAGSTLLIATNDGLRHYDFKHETFALENVNLPARLFETSYRNEAYSNPLPYVFQDTVKQYGVVELSPETEYDNEVYYNDNYFGYNVNTYYCTYGNIYNQDGLTISGLQFWGTEAGLFQNLWDGAYQSSNGHKKYLSGVNITKITSIYSMLSFGERETRENMLVGSSHGLYFTNSIFNSYPISPTASIYYFNDLGNIRINDICVNATSYATPVCENGIWVAAANGLYFLTTDIVPYVDQNPIIPAISFDGAFNPTGSITTCSESPVKANLSSYYYTGNNIQWYKNGEELPGAKGDSLNITSAGDYNAILYDDCSNVHFSTNHLKVNVTSSPVFTFNYPDKIEECSGTSIILKTEANTLYRYRWYTNGNLNGDTTYSLTAKQSGKYKLEVSACNNSWVGTKEVEVNFLTLPQPSVSTDKSQYCIGDYATLNAGIAADTTYDINWYKDGQQLVNFTNQTSITVNTSGNYSVSLVKRNSNTDGSYCSNTSGIKTITFNLPPQISLTQIINTTLCSGQTVDLVANYAGGSVKWSTGETTDRISVSTAGTYKATVTSVSGCSADTSITVSFYDNPLLKLKDTSICVYKNQPVVLIAPPGFSKYQWNGEQGNQTYAVTLPGSVQLTVTDVNGCTASQQINVADKCADVIIPNAFTPNNDGINDTWVIEGLLNDQSATVFVYNRYGVLVFQSRGYGVPWNGQYQGKRIPSGVYYYVISAKNNTQKFSGSLTIIY